MTDTPTLTLWSFPDDWYEDGGRAILEPIGLLDRTFRQEHGCMIGAQQVCLFDHECETVLVEVTYE